jgi:hypothetical protein
MAGTSTCTRKRRILVLSVLVISGLLYSHLGKVEFLPWGVADDEKGDNPDDEVVVNVNGDAFGGVVLVPHKQHTSKVEDRLQHDAS